MLLCTFERATDQYMLAFKLTCCNIGDKEEIKPGQDAKGFEAGLFATR